MHFDGHPETRLPILRALIRRDGVERVVDTIIGKPNGWLTLDENQADESPDDDDVVVVARYGEQFIGEIANSEYWAPGGNVPDESTSMSWVRTAASNGLARRSSRLSTS
ncbi:hypothetical protein CCUG60884_00234 [Mycobacteroides salmoniphilum]|uniref:Uncharacterized protein n=1 Tax=Mycobacteroides salmoniphilum TaxID=404941 RepID=A0A4R8SZY9_9MYCO|nr:hypothetical protein CCUG60884_00234 [Mycobacteroides salmoniphilum]